MAEVLALLSTIVGDNFTNSSSFIMSNNCGTLRGDIVSMLTHAYPQKPLRKIKVTVCNHHDDSPLYVWPVVLSGDLQV